MGFWSNLFSSGPRDLPGWYVAVPKVDILDRNTSLIERNLKLLEEYIVSNGKHYSIELTFDGWEADERPVFNIPEVVSWCELVQQKHPEFLIFLAPGPLLRFSMCIDPSFWTWVPSGRLILEADRTEIMNKISMSTVTATLKLQQSGLDQAGVLALAQSAKENLDAALNQASYELGTHYIVSLPAQDTRLGEPPV